MSIRTEPDAAAQPGVLDRAKAAAMALRARLGELMTWVGGDEPRVRNVVYRLGIDKSMASRVLRAVRSTDPGSVLNTLPSDEGIALVVDAAGRAGCPAPLCEGVRAASAALEAAVAEVPGGRAVVRGAIVAAGERERGALERDARRAMFQSLALLSGVRLDARYSLLAFGPGDVPGKADFASLTVLQGLRRVRAGRSMVLMRLSGNDLAEEDPQRVRLDGGRFDDDPLSCILPELSSDAAHAVSVERDGRRYSLVLGPSEPPLERPLTFAMGSRTRGFQPARAVPGEPYSCITLALLRATEHLVVDVMFAPGMWEGMVPSLVFALDVAKHPDPALGPGADGRDTLDLGASLEPMGTGFARRGSARADRFLPAAQVAFDRLGWDPSGFRRYRLDVVYPVPLVGVQIWMRLPG